MDRKHNQLATLQMETSHCSNSAEDVNGNWPQPKRECMSRTAGLRNSPRKWSAERKGKKDGKEKRAGGHMRD